MTTPPPDNPQVNQVWVDDAGDLYTWDGTQWVPYEDMPYFDPGTAYRDA